MSVYPFLSDAFFDALQGCGAVNPKTGWQPCHLEADGGWMPLYARSHSRGEYVFDYSWADAYQRHGLDYYPKLVTSIPFTPVTGARWQGDISADSLWGGVQELPLVSRQACHFRWVNRDYRDFDDFLGQFQSRKRKNLRKERRRVQEQGLTITRHQGGQISANDWAFFYQCYASTYLKRGQLPYLNEAFFSTVGERLADQLMLVLARDRDRPVAAALYFFDADCLYGRYWGCLEERDGLHFELCYYQGIEFAIERQLAAFDPGVQGEHKILRGFEPVITWSMHHLREPAFHNAIADFCREEAVHVQRYREEAMTLLPFRKGGGD